MTAILDEIMKHLPKEAQISESCFECANIILYTKSKDFLINQGMTIKKVVDIIKKRIELRPDPSLCMEQDKAEEEIRRIISPDAGITNILFDPQRSQVVIEAEKPGLAIGKQGELLREIKYKTFWVPLVNRTPALKSKIIENIRMVLYENSDYRRKFLDKVGHRIYDGWRQEKTREWVKATFLGAGRQVGRSCVFLRTAESSVLLDCGVNIAASDQNAYPALDFPEFSIDKLDAIILSHSHLDHSGFAPYLYKMGFRGPTYSTAPTRDISALLALDYIGVAFKQAKKMIYDVADVKEMVKHTICLDYGEVTDITPDLRLTFHNAGHVLGSSMAHLHIGNGLHNLVYSGDMKYIRTRLLEPAQNRFPRVETLIIESTYGAKEDVLGSRRDAELEIFNTIKETISNGGKVLIPVLGVGRAQEIMLVLEDAYKKGMIPKVPVYVHGMVWDVTAIHTAYPDFLNDNVKKAIFHRDQNPFLSELFRRVGSRKEQMQVVDEEGPCVILATAGMLNAGASLEYFKHLAPNPKNTIIFVTYQAENTVGKKVQQGDKEVTISDGHKQDVLPVRMNVVSIRSFTGHAGRNELMKYAHDINPRPRRVIVNHGEASKCLDLASSWHKMQHIQTIAPKNLEVIRIC